MWRCMCLYFAVILVSVYLQKEYVGCDLEAGGVRRVHMLGWGSTVCLLLSLLKQVRCYHRCTECNTLWRLQSIVTCSTLWLLKSICYRCIINWKTFAPEIHFVGVTSDKNFHIKYFSTCFSCFNLKCKNRNVLISEMRRLSLGHVQMHIPTRLLNEALHESYSLTMQSSLGSSFHCEKSFQ